MFKILLFKQDSWYCFLSFLSNSPIDPLIYCYNKMEQFGDEKNVPLPKKLT